MITNVEVIEIIKEASKRVYENVKNLAGTDAAAGDFGRGAGGDISRNIDIIAEKTVLDYLREINFECVVLGEECGKVELSSSPKGYIIMDAIDGSANAVRGIPFFCCSLAFATEFKLSSVTDAAVTNLATGDIYWACKDKGAFCNSNKIQVSNKEPVYRIVGINTSGAKKDLMEKLQPLFEQHNHSRHFGANALEMAIFSQGLMDAFVDLRDKIRITDVAAGYLLVKEAGGILVDANIEPLDSDLGYEARVSFIAASNRKILDEIVSSFKS